ncbi:fructose-specific component phosphotransferase system IIB-like protein [Nitrobacteraceae bacterium AZCC 2299]
MDEGDAMLVAVIGEVTDHREIVGLRIGDVDLHLVMAVLEHVEERRASPVGGGLALLGRAIFERIALVGLGVVPAEAAALEDRVQRVDENEAARQLEPTVTTAFAEAADQVVFRQTGEPLADQPAHQFQSWCGVHGSI